MLFQAGKFHTVIETGSTAFGEADKLQSQSIAARALEGPSIHPAPASGLANSVSAGDLLHLLFNSFTIKYNR